MPVLEMSRSMEQERPDDAGPRHYFNPTAMSQLEGRPVVRSPEQLQLHPALEEVGWVGVIGELNEASGQRTCP